MKTILIITTLLYVAAAYKLFDDAVFPQIKIVDEAIESFHRQTRQAAGNLDQKVRVLFLLGDTDNNNLISSSELASFLTRFGGLSASTATEISNIFVRMGDTNGDGELSREEYKTVAAMYGN